MVTEAASHVTVLLEEAVAALQVSPGGIYVDATFGRGGHSGAIIEQLQGSGLLVAFDRDPAAMATATEQFSNHPLFSFYHARFTTLTTHLETRSLLGRVNGIIVDLGVSSPQLDEAGRGFSFRQEGPLDMRMDSSSGITAAQWLSSVGEEALIRVLWEYGEERYARRIARAILRYRQQEGEITTTRILAEIVAAATPRHERDRHPATRTFQAIRIEINRELEELERLLQQVIPALAVGGRLVVISFHSLEDRRVKRFMREASRGEQHHPDLPLRQDQLQPPHLRLVGKAVRPGVEEVRRNPRARSAVMRVAEKVA
ncbi:MAG: 16S rRNA (cytosine(1402)-N(4))-methyltransferase RsmH [Gammaproteobacteria bacterium]|nr:16S rRNA (cytosine(1402)-N(4))-methyltransferase RsmH [Gammaproteobacteria bacterium]